MAIYRFVSDEFNTYVRIPPAAFGAGKLAEDIGKAFSFWPQIVSENLGPGSQPQYIWATDPISQLGALNGEQQNFGRAATLTGLTLSADRNLPFNIMVFADNAYIGKLKISAMISNALTTITLIDIPDEGFSLNTSFKEEEAPYKWHNITAFSGEVIIPTKATGVRFDLEIEALNYAQVNGTPASNPAGVQFLLELYNLPENLTVNNVIPKSLYL